VPTVLASGAPLHHVPPGSPHTHTHLAPRRIRFPGLACLNFELELVYSLDLDLEYAGGTYFNADNLNSDVTGKVQVCQVAALALPQPGY
jgi:hypothetical protein